MKDPTEADGKHTPVFSEECPPEKHYKKQGE